MAETGRIIQKELTLTYPDGTTHVVFRDVKEYDNETEQNTKDAELVALLNEEIRQGEELNAGEEGE